MNVFGSLRFALRGISANKLRSMLTTLGILIGVAAVIVLLSVGTGSSAAVKKSIARLGTETLTVNRSAGGNGRAGTAAGGAGGAFGGGGFAARGGGGRTASSGGTNSQSTNLTIADAAALLAPGAASAISDDAPVITTTGVTGAYTGVTHSVSAFIGTTPSYLPINNWTISNGTSFSDADYTSRSDVAVIGTTDADDLFGTPAAAIGQVAQFNGKNFTIVGVLKSKGSTGFQDQDDIVIIPLTTAEDEFSGVTASLSSIIVQAKSAGQVNNAQTQIYTLLDGRHQVTSTTRDYTVQNPTTIVAAATSSTKTLTVLLGAVAALSLLVGGIGVMNIMLVTVTERTREIGIRKAIGAAKSDIVVQFVAEAVMLSVIGALVGVAVGLIGSRFTIVGVQPVVAPWSIFLAFGVAVAVGLFFGIYPANRAASLKPIDALRYE